MVHLVLWIIPVLQLVLFAITYCVALGQPVQMDVVMPALIGLMFAIIGNYLPKCKQNYTIGIKIPWTLESEENWNKTHRMAGWLWLFCGIVLMLSGILSVVWKFSIWVLLAVMPVMVFVPVVYSYGLHRKGV